MIFLALSTPVFALVNGHAAVAAALPEVAWHDGKPEPHDAARAPPARHEDLPPGTRPARREGFPPEGLARSPGGR
jgi:hypothetical protein